MDIDIDELLTLMSNYLVDNKATDVMVLDVERKTKATKRLLICTASSAQNAKDLASAFKEEFNKYSLCLHTDGIFKGEWIVLDFKDILVHIFTKETRSRYNLEKLYKDSKNFIQIPRRKVVKK